MPEFPLWRLRPEDAARLIILEPLKPVERHKFWYKRAMRLKPSDKKVEPYLLKGARHKPGNADMRRLALAKPDHRGDLNSYWKQFFQEYAEAFPLIGVRIGPLMRNGKFESQTDKVANPLPAERQREPWQGMYSRDQFEADTAYFEAARALLRENYILGQQGEGPYLDGLVFLKADNLILAEMEHCKARLRMTWAILEQRKLAKAMAQPKKEKNEAWQYIKDEAIAMQFKKSGYTVQYLGMHNYRVQMK